MNLLLFEPHEIAAPLPRTDRRAIHLLDVLRRREGDTFDAAVVNGPRGKGTLDALDSACLFVSFRWIHEALPPEPVTLIVGLPRPQTARDILRDATSLGVGALHFVLAEKGDANYARSSLWSSGEWRRHLLFGAEQAFDPRIPEVTFGQDLAAALAALPAGSTRFACDNYEAAAPLAQVTPASFAHLALALGPERGWSAGERELLRARAFTLVHLGPRVLRTETAAIVALTLARKNK